MTTAIEAPKLELRSRSDEGLTRAEFAAIAIGVLLLMGAEAAVNNPAILFGRYLWFDELQSKLVLSQPGIWHSMAVLAHSGDITPPTYDLAAAALWWLARIFGGSAETTWRFLSFSAIWLALVLTYAVLRRSSARLPALIAILTLWACPLTLWCAFFARPYALLMAASAAFCFAYCGEESHPVMTAVFATFDLRAPLLRHLRAFSDHPRRYGRAL